MDSDNFLIALSNLSFGLMFIAFTRRLWRIFVPIFCIAGSLLMWWAQRGISVGTGIPELETLSRIVLIALILFAVVRKIHMVKGEDDAEKSV
jgi:hypothetical protein